MPLLYYEDFALGQKFETGSIEVTAEEMVSFASRYDPQPFHLTETAGRESAFGGLAASGWLTASLTMRLFVDSIISKTSGMIGLGVESLQWPRPVRPGDRLSASSEVIALRLSASKPDFGVIAMKTVTSNQAGEPVLSMVSHKLVRRRPR